MHVEGGPRARYSPRVVDEADPSAQSSAIDRDGVDRTLIREMLALAPWERLRRLERLAEMIQRIREANGIRAVP